MRAFQAVPGYGLRPLSCGDGVVCATTAWLPTPYVRAGTTGEMQIVLTSDAARAAPLRSALGAYTPFYTIYVDRKRRAACRAGDVRARRRPGNGAGRGVGRWQRDVPSRNADTVRSLRARRAVAVD